MIHRYLVYLTLLSVFSFIFSLVMLILESDDEEMNSTVIATLIVFGGMSLCLLTFLRYLYMRHGHSKFTLETNPAEFGGTLKGKIETNAKLTSLEGVTLKLVCREYKKDKVKRIWSSAKDVVPVIHHSARKNVEVPVDFEIPCDQPATSKKRGKSYEWCLQVEDKVKKLFKYRAWFEVPVFDLGKGVTPVPDLTALAPTSKKVEEEHAPVLEMMFGLLSLAFAGCVGYFGAVDLVKYQQMGSWEEKPATILRCGLGGRGQQQRNHTFVEYQYHYEGETYTGKNVTLFKTAAREKVHQDWFKELRAHQFSGEPFRCFINPQNPTISVLYREMSTAHLMLVLLFLLPSSVFFGYHGVRLNISAYRGHRILRNARMNSETVHLEREPGEGNQD